MKIHSNNPAIRQGQFLWMDESAKRNYITMVKKRIEDGYYFTEQVVTRIVDEIAPVMNDTIEHDGAI